MYQQAQGPAGRQGGGHGVACVCQACTPAALELAPQLGRLMPHFDLGEEREQRERTWNSPEGKKQVGNHSRASGPPPHWRWQELRGHTHARYGVARARGFPTGWEPMRGQQTAKPYGGKRPKVPWVVVEATLVCWQAGGQADAGCLGDSVLPPAPSSSLPGGGN